jgi:hypothetical protein
VIDPYGTPSLYDAATNVLVPGGMSLIVACDDNSHQVCPVTGPFLAYAPALKLAPILPTALAAITTRDISNPVQILMPDTAPFTDCNGVVTLATGRLYLTPVAGGGGGSLGEQATPTGYFQNGSGIKILSVDFDQPVDLEYLPSSFQTGAEQLTIITVPNEFVAGPGSTQPSQLNMPAGTIWSNGNDVATSQFIWRNVTHVDIQVRSTAGVNCGITINLLASTNGFKPVPC